MVSLTNILGVYNMFRHENDNKMDFQEEVICHLKFIGKVQENEKINVRHMFVQSNSLASRISRSFINTDCRTNTINFLLNTIKQSIDIINLYIQSEKALDRIKCINIISDLKQSLIGINNIKKTYGDDIMISCKIETMHQDITSFLLDIEQKHPELFHTKQNI